jgi:fluoroquinolone transport system ATP-binding protein
VAFIVDGEIKTIDSPRSLKLQYGHRRVRVEYDGGQPQEFNLDGLGHNENFIHLLQSRPVQTIHTQETTLESIFIKVTGQQLA